MLNLNQIHRLTSIINKRNAIRLITSKNYSTKIAVTQKIDAELERTIDKITNVTSKEIKKKPQKPPFAKNLFLGTYDTDILAYPEILEKNEVESLEHSIVPISDFFENINRNEGPEVTKNYLETLQNLRLLGLQAQSLDGGRQLCLTETLRYYEEMAKADGKIGVIQSEELGLQTLLRHGSHNLKKYIKDFIDGKTIAAFCVNDPPGETTKAKLSGDGKYWVINGKKQWIVNGSTADVFVVLAESEHLNNQGLREINQTVLLVHKDFGGITSKSQEIYGLSGTDVSDVVFENTPVPVEYVLGEVNAGTKIVHTVLSEFRLASAPICSTVLRKGLNNFVKYCINTETANGNISETEMVQGKLGELVSSVYAIESMAYLTAGLLDQYENQDCELECAITKAFSIEQCQESLLKMMKFIGPPTLSKDNLLNKLHQDSMGHLLLHEPVDSLKLIIALLGLQHAGVNINEKIRVLRNPLFHPGYILRRIWNQRKHVDDDPPLRLKLHQYLHPSLKNSAEMLEYCVLRLEFATETLLARHGPEIICKHIDLLRLADCVIDIYATTAVLGRASRAYCIGLQHADQELQIAIGFAVNAMERVKEKVNKIFRGSYNTADEKLLSIGKYAITNKGYHPVHPLTRNF